QNGIKVEPLQAALMHGGNGPAMTSNPDEAHKALLPRFDRRFQRPAWPHCHVPVVRVKQGMQLNQVHHIHPQAFERPMDLVTGILVKALPGLGGEEEILAMARHPGSNPQFGIPIACRNVDMIDAVFEEDVQDAIRLGLGGTAERCRTEERHRAHVCSASKRSFLNHRCSFPVRAGARSALLVMSFLLHPAEPGHHGLWEQDTDSPRVIGVVYARWDVYHGTQYRPLSPREQ